MRELRPNLLLFASVAALVFCSRLPFLGAGYGSDDDAWKIALAGRIISATGRYTVSRFPGYPVPELTGALIGRGGPWVFNGATALAGALGTAFFALSLREMRCRGALPAVAALAFTPVVFVNSTSSMDYVWALACLLAALHFSILRRPVAAGILLGLSIGCRITSAMMLLPLSLILAGGSGVVAEGADGSGLHAVGGGHAMKRPQWPRRAVAALVSAALVTGGACFIPVVLTYGTAFLTFFTSGRPTLGRAIQTATTGVWGGPGFLAVLLTALLALLRLPWPPASPSLSLPAGSKDRLAWSLAAGLSLLLFVALPLEAGYLIPAVPFVLLLLASTLDRRLFAAACIAIVASSFFSFCQRGLCAGRVFEDQVARRAGMAVTRNILLRAESLQGSSLIVVGPKSLTRIKASLPLDSFVGVPVGPPGEPRRSAASPAPATNQAPAVRGPVKYVAYLGSKEMEDEMARGRTIYYLDGASESNFRRTGLDLRASPARPLDLSSPD